MADKYLHQQLIPAAATETVLYTVPAANTGIIKSLRVTNADNNPADISVKQVDTTAGLSSTVFYTKSRPWPQMLRLMSLEESRVY